MSNLKTLFWDTERFDLKTRLLKIFIAVWIVSLFLLMVTASAIQFTSAIAAPAFLLIWLGIQAFSMFIPLIWALVLYIFKN